MIKFPSETRHNQNNMKMDQRNVNWGLYGDMSPSRTAHAHIIQNCVLALEWVSMGFYIKKKKKKTHKHEMKWILTHERSCWMKTVWAYLCCVCDDVFNIHKMNVMYSIGIHLMLNVFYEYVGESHVILLYFACCLLPVACCCCSREWMIWWFGGGG